MIYKSKLNQIAQQLQKGLAVIVLGAATLTSCSPNNDVMPDIPKPGPVDVPEFGNTATRGAKEAEIRKEFNDEFKTIEIIEIKKDASKKDKKKLKKYNKKAGKYNKALEAYNTKLDELIEKAQKYDNEETQKDPMGKNKVTLLGLRRTTYQSVCKKKESLIKLKQQIEEMDV